MKIRITYKTAREFFPMYKVGYCDLQETLRHENPIFYTANNYGWRCDYYKLIHSKTGKIIRICTGYGPIGIDTDYKIIQQIEQKSYKMRTYTKRKTKTILRKKIDYLIDNINKKWNDTSEK